MAQRTTLKEFEAVFPKLEADLVEHAESYKLPQKQIDWYKAVGDPADMPPSWTPPFCRGRPQF